jgi:hypothetical protein
LRRKQRANEKFAKCSGCVVNARRRVSRVLSRPLRKFSKGGDGHSSGTLVTERLVRPTRAAARRSAWKPGFSGQPAAPIRSCSRWGFPCRRRYRRRGALLPHRFTLAARPVFPRERRCTFCGTFPGVAPAGCYPAPYLRGARTFLSLPRSGERPSGRLATEDLGTRAGAFKGLPQKPICTHRRRSIGPEQVVPRRPASIIGVNHSRDLGR